MGDHQTITNTDAAVPVAAFASHLELNALPPEVVEAVKRNIQDVLACAIAGSSALAVDEVASLLQGWGGAAQADVFVRGGRFPAHNVAWLNSAMSHARDYDDTHDAAILHAGVSIVPAALAAAQLRGDATGADVLAGIAAGLEVMCRLGVAIQVDIVESGFIYSSLLGYFGATAAAGRVLGLDADAMLNALGIVYSSVAGNHQVTRDASLMKRLQPGLAAQAALVAVQLAAHGVRGAQEVFEGKDGFFRVYLQDQVKVATLTSRLGETWELLNLSYKPYPCCRDVHSTVDAVLELRALSPRPADEITSIRVGLTGPGYQMVCTPEAVRVAPSTIVEAQFSIPFTAATAWIDGGLTIEHFSDAGISRKDLLELAKRVHPYVDQEIDDEWRRYVTPSKVEITFTDGSSVQTRVNYAKGHPNNMMSEAEFEAKAADCVRYAAVAMAPDTATRLIEVVRNLDEAPDVTDLLAVMSGTSTR